MLIFSIKTWVSCFFMGAGGPGCGDGRKPYFPESDLSLEIYVDRARWEHPALAASRQVHGLPGGGPSSARVGRPVAGNTQSF